MPTFRKPENENYCATIVRIKNIIPLENCDNVVATTIFGFQAIVGKAAQIGDAGIVFTTETQLSDQFAAANNLYRHAERNGNPTLKGYLEDNRRVRAVKFRGHISNALFLPLSAIAFTGVNVDDLEEGDVFGRGPGHIALPDIRSLNKVKELGWQAPALQVRPPLMVPHDGVRGGKTRLTPASENVMLDDREIKPIQLGQDLKSEMVKADELRQAIRGVFHRDLVSLPDKNYMTATEIIKQLDLTHRELGPTIGNIQDQFLRPLIDRAFGLMWRKQQFLEPPPDLAGADLDVTYEGPLARAQRSGDMTAYQGALALVAGMAQFDEQVLDNLDTDEQVNYIWQVSGVPMRLLRSKGKRQQIRDARSQAAQQAAAIEGAQGTADVALTGAQAMGAAKEAMQPQGTA